MTDGWFGGNGAWSLRRQGLEVARVWRAHADLWGIEVRGQILAAAPGFEAARQVAEA